MAIGRVGNAILVHYEQIVVVKGTVTVRPVAVGNVCLVNGKAGLIVPVQLHLYLQVVIAIVQHAEEVIFHVATAQGCNVCRQHDKRKLKVCCDKPELGVIHALRAIRYIDEEHVVKVVRHFIVKVERICCGGAHLARGTEHV